MAKTVSRILRRTERKIEDVLAEDQCGHRRGKGTRDTTGMVTIISE
jgi:2-methylisocitrate lyase-like PEP mutase family enzyme